MQGKALTPGDRIPSFKTPSRVNPAFNFDSVAGRWLVLGCVGSLTTAQHHPSVDALIAETTLFNDKHASLFLLSSDPADREGDAIPDRIPGLRVLWDTDLTVTQRLGLAPSQPQDPPNKPSGS